MDKNWKKINEGSWNSENKFNRQKQRIITIW